MKHARTLLTVLLLAPLAALHAADAPPQSWKPANPVLMTRWGKTVTPENALPEYPRPQMVRTEWRNLNGLWQFAVGQPDEPVPVGKTLAPDSGAVSDGVGAVGDSRDGGVRLVSPHV